MKQQEKLEASSSSSYELPLTDYNSNCSSDSVIVDLTQITSSDLDIPSDLSLIEDYWDDSIDLADLNSLSLTALDLPFSVKYIFSSTHLNNGVTYLGE